MEIPQRRRDAAKLKRLIAELDHQVRRMGAQSVMTSQAVAARFGLHTTDLECLDLIFMRGQATAGELARATGLTSGAVTALIDRLERAGYIVRVDDPRDRRRVLVRVNREAITPIQAVYAPMQRRMFGLWSTFSERRLEIVIDFLKRATDLAIACTEEVSKGSPAMAKRRPARTARMQTT
jgi:DNA-binding MarR family transcriptional regulator